MSVVSVVNPSASQRKNQGVAIILMRAQPFHNGHAAILRHALQTYEGVVVLLGSANRGRSHHHNPFTISERKKMLEYWLEFDYCNEFDLCRDQVPVIIRFMHDFISDGQWALSVTEIVRDAALDFTAGDDEDLDDQITMLISAKGSDSNYVDHFPQWKSEVLPTYTFASNHVATPVTLNATDLRKVLFDPNGLTGTADWKHLIPAKVGDYLVSLMKTSVGDALREGHRAQDAYLARWGNGPFITTDAVVLSAGHIILGQRTENPGKGQYCLPGGFLMPEERLVDGMIRELIEETGIKLQPLVLKRNIRHSIVVDDPKRGGRGRNVTHAYLVVLNDRLQEGLPKLQGVDDLGAPRWVPLNRIPWSEMFEDHALIIENLLRFL